MLRAVVDTHAIIWYIFGDTPKESLRERRLSITAQNAIAQIASNGDRVAFSSITLAEIVYLSEKGRISPLTLERLLAAVDATDAVLVEVPFNRDISRWAGENRNV